jgi:tetratricopeptide (TPR) repeat protein/predicted Ser/Thr protein kinase
LDALEISHYRIIRKLGAGGMGEVFLAEDTKLERKVAIKMLPPRTKDNENARQRLIREAKAAATLDHSNICAIHEVGQDGDRTFIVMQYIEGESLSHKIRQKPLPIGEVVNIGIQTAGALEEAHSRGIIHRDIKPGNVIITPRGQLKILDFGLAKFTSERQLSDPGGETEARLTETGQVVGTPGYSSPEQLQGQDVDARSDVFSLGVMLYQCATARHAFSGITPIQVSLQVVNSEPPRPSQINPSIPAALDRIIAKAMSKSRDERYESASAMRADLEKFQAALKDQDAVGTRPLESNDAESAPVMPTATFEPIAAPRPRLNRKTAIVAAAIAVVLAASFLLWRYVLHAEYTPPAEAKVWYDRGTAAIREGAYYQASKALERAIEIAPQFALAHARLADAYAEIDYTDKAREEMLRSLSLAPSGSLSAVDTAYLEAISATVRRDFGPAIESYKTIVDEVADSEKAAAYVDLGRSYEKNEAIDKAIESYSKATSLDPQSAAGYLRMAILYGRQLNRDKAAEAFDQAEKIYQAASSQEGLAEVYYQRGSTFARIRQLPEAKAQLDRALEISRGSANRFQTVRTQLQLSSVYSASGDSEQAKRVAEEAIATAQAANIRALATDGLIDIGYTLLSRGEFTEAGSYLNRALEFSSADRTVRTEARARLALASLNLQQNKHDEAIAFAQQALKFFEPSGYRKETLNGLIILGRAYRDKGDDYERARKTFEQQLEVARQLNAPAQTAASLSSLALLVGLHQERYAEALPYLDESLKINRSIGAKVGIGWDQMNRSALLWQMGRYEEATAALDEAYSIANRPEARFKSQLAWVELTRAQVALSQQHFAEAREKALVSAGIAGTQYEDIELFSKATTALALALSGSGASARRPAEEALAMARKLNGIRDVSTVMLNLAEVLLLTGDAQGALANAVQAQSIFAAAGQTDSEWRALLIAARASQKAGNASAAVDYAVRADKQRAALQSKWGNDVYEKYSRRPDIQNYLKQLSQLLPGSK